MYTKFFKRLFDFTFSLLFLIIASPVLVSISVILFLINKGEIFFVQPRPGKDEKIFSIIKFKTMDERKDKNGKLLPDNERITQFGKFIRNNSLDEIPQLFNVLKGDISLVGPRPLLVEYLPLYNDFQRRRHNLKPGITGWAQVNGRNTISWDEKFKLDVWYVDNVSFKLDINILILTIKKVFSREDINSSEIETMEIFCGNSK